jgi:hypothetical protein
MYFVNYSDSSGTNIPADPQHLLITGFHKLADPFAIFKARLINYNIRKYSAVTTNFCSPEQRSTKDFNDIVKSLSAFGFCKQDDSIGIIFVRNNITGLKNQLSDSCIVKLHVP